jgi:anti-sigma factor RsiW
MTPFCWLVRRRLDAYQDGELSPGARSRVAAHLGRCEPCGRELAALGRLRAALTLTAVDPPEVVWATFWPEVRARIAAPAPAPAPEPAWRRAWEALTSRPRLALAPALAVAALAVVAVLAPWQRAPELPLPAPGVGGSGVATVQPAAALDQVVIQSIETADPDVPVMVYSSPESDVTVLWVFGLEPTGV